MPKIRKTKTTSIKEPTIIEYAQTLADIKIRIKEAQIKAALSANKVLLKLYWSIGETIVQKQEKLGWGSKVIERLAKDLQNYFPGMGGFSRTNIFRMRAFYLAYAIIPVAPGHLEDLVIFNIPWWHNAILIEKLKENKERIWYAQKTIENGWSATALEEKIKSNLYNREGKAITNFTRALPNKVIFAHSVAKNATFCKYLDAFF